MKIIFDSQFLNTVEERTFHCFSFKDLICRLVYLIHQRADLSHNTGLFISPSGICELDCATTKTDTAERSISIGRESLLFYTRALGVLPGSTARG